MAGIWWLREAVASSHRQSKHLRELMQARGVGQRELWKVFGSKGITSQVVNGKRGISKKQAKALGEFFHVSPALFL